MPRTLPWKQNASELQSRLKGSSKSSAVATKRKRVKSQTLDSDSEGHQPMNSKQGKKTLRAPSSSPPLSPPPESLMREGLDKDDKYRMVEDEFLSVAQKFTVHLHAAEYKKQQKMAQSRNAETITSISRPAVGRMPDDTKRRLEGVKRSETQRATLGKMMEKAKVSDDSDSGDGLPYIGTTLHGLMDGPRRRTISLAKIAPTATSTRSAAGFSKRATQSKDPMYESHRLKKTAPLDLGAIGDSSTASDEDDDLDAPIQAPRATKKDENSSTTAKTSFLEGRMVNSHAPSESKARGSRIFPIEQETVRDTGETFTDITSPLSKPRTRRRIPRLGQFTEVNSGAGVEPTIKRSRDIIPSFL